MPGPIACYVFVGRVSGPCSIVCVNGRRWARGVPIVLLIHVYTENTKKKIQKQQKIEKYKNNIKNAKIQKQQKIEKYKNNIKNAKIQKQQKIEKYKNNIKNAKIQKTT